MGGGVQGVLERRFNNQEYGRFSISTDIYKTVVLFPSESGELDQILGIIKIIFPRGPSGFRH